MRKVVKMLTFTLMFIIVLDFKLPVNAVEKNGAEISARTFAIKPDSNFDVQIRKGKDVARTSNGIGGKIFSLSSNQVGIAFINSGTKSFEIQLRNNKGRILNKIYATSSNPRTYCVFDISKDKLYSYRIRGVSFNGVPAPTTKWSNSVYFTTANYKITQVGNGKRFKIKTPKVTGIKNYKIYMSLKKNGGWKKIKTVTAGKEVIISKFKGKALKKKQNYYYKIIPNKGSVQVGGVRFY